MCALADGDVEPEVDPQWLELQRLMADDVAADGEPTIEIPYARALAEMIPPAATRLRRDFGAILGLIRAHALLHRATRTLDEDERTIASIEDYAVVRELVADLISEGVGATVSPETRETVQTVAQLAPDQEDGVRQTLLAAELKLDRGTVSRRVRKALDGGYLRNLEEKRGKPHRLLPDDQLPEERVILPEPEELHGCTVAETPRGPTDNGAIPQPSDRVGVRYDDGEPER
jgi:hypothetical protein